MKHFFAFLIMALFVCIVLFVPAAAMAAVDAPVATDQTIGDTLMGILTGWGIPGAVGIAILVIVQWLLGVFKKPDADDSEG